MNRAKLWLILLGVCLVAIWCEAKRPPATTGSEQSETFTSPAADAPLYKARVDEGLGASVAILVDHSGSMVERVEGGPKWQVARAALEQTLAATDSFATARPDYPVNVGIYGFDTDVQTYYPMARYDGARVRAALAQIPRPDGSTAIGRALDFAREELYKAGTFRKYILVLTDGENTAGVDPAGVAEEIWRRSEHGVSMYFVAFDVAADRFSFVKQVGGEVFQANGAAALRQQLNEVYRSRILAEDPGKAEPAPAPDSARGARTGGN